MYNSGGLEEFSFMRFLYPNNLRSFLVYFQMKGLLYNVLYGDPFLCFDVYKCM